MTIPLSDDTKKLVDAVMAPRDRERIARRLVDQVSENVPFCSNSHPVEMERIRFSVLRLLAEGQMREDDVFRLACTDWRDLFMAAGHATPGQHEQWAQRMLRRGAQPGDASDPRL